MSKANEKMAANVGETAAKPAENRPEKAIALPTARSVTDLGFDELHAGAVKALEDFRAYAGAMASRSPSPAATSGLPAINTAALRILDQYAPLAAEAAKQAENNRESGPKERGGAERSPVA